jgi:hypothetical protein
MAIETSNNSNPTSLVCPECKKETGITKELVMASVVLEDLYCPFCKKLVFSSKPVVERFVYTPTTNWSEADYD